jgi:RHS repeat-associated protein
MVTQPEYSLTLGYKQYELSNHLGNVQATLSDKKLGLLQDESSTFAGYEVDLLSAVDYYPFGLQMPERGVSGGYRYGFNGKEKDDEMHREGDTYDFGARIYDSRLGRWLSLDPLQAKYPSFTPYSFVNNSPLIFIDPDGKLLKVATIEGQIQTIAILKRAFGEKSKDFCFDESGYLRFTGNPASFKNVEAEVFNGLHQVITAFVITNIVYTKNANTDKNGGEATTTIHDFPESTENTIYIDPVDFFETVLKVEKLTEYEDKNGGKTTNPDLANTDSFGNPKKTGTVKTEKYTINDSKAARFFHGIGHVLNQKNSEQEKVIDFENKARSIFKSEKKNGTFKSDPEEKRNIDEKHKNKPD